MSILIRILAVVVVFRRDQIYTWVDELLTSRGFKRDAPVGQSHVRGSVMKISIIEVVRLTLMHNALISWCSCMFVFQAGVYVNHNGDAFDYFYLAFDIINDPRKRTTQINKPATMTGT